MADFNQRVGLLACYMVFPSILRRNKLEMFHEDTISGPELDGRDFLFLRHCPYGCEHFGIFSFGFSCFQAELIPDYWNKSDDFWDSFRSFRSSQSSESVSISSLQNLHHRPDRPDRSSQSNESFAIVQVVFPYDRPDRLNII